MEHDAVFIEDGSDSGNEGCCEYVRQKWQITTEMVLVKDSMTSQMKCWRSGKKRERKIYPQGFKDF
eukprot:7961103-Ditylum_brightwellii.AAC.1